METIRTCFLWDAFVDLGVDATTLGRAELLHWNTIDSLRLARPIPIVASNLFHSTTTSSESENDAAELEPVGERALLLERAGVRIGLLGLLDPGQVQSLPVESRELWTVVDPLHALEELLPQLREESDLIVLLSQMPPAETDALLSQVSGIDIALYGLRAPREEDAARIGSTWILRSGLKGQYLGFLELSLAGPHEVEEIEADTRALDQRFEMDPDWAARVARGLAEGDSARAEYLRRDQEAFEALFK